MDHYDAWFSWNHKKNYANVRKHGISFYDACEVFYNGNSMTRRTHDGRFITIGRVHSELYSVIWENEGELRRIVSARLAQDGERRRYDQEHNR